MECIDKTFADEGERNNGTDATDLALRVGHPAEHVRATLRNAACERPLNELFVQVDAARVIAVRIGDDEWPEMFLSRTALAHDAHEVFCLDAHPFLVLLAGTPLAKRCLEVECEKFRNLKRH